MLGPLVVRVADAVLTTRGVKERVLALLVAHAGAVVPVDDIVEALWGADVPRSATKSVQVYVARLRAALEPGGRAGQPIIQRRGSGYCLLVDRGEVDAFRFADLLSRGRQAATGGAPDVAGRVLREALGLWRGPAYADFRDTWFGTTEAARLEELRVSAVEERIDAHLAMGRDAQLIGELEALVAEHPLRERLWGQLMTALYRSDRQAEALAAFRRARTLLVEQVGLEPSGRLQVLEQQILVQDPALAPAEGTSSGGEGE